MSNDCRHVRLAIGAEPHAPTPEVTAHLATCAACRQFQAETLALDGRLRAALELPLSKFRKPASAASRRLALAASVALALLVGGGIWLFRPQSALASEVIAHIDEEPGSWNPRDPLSLDQLVTVLAKAGVYYDPQLPVTYASPCPFRGHIVPHLVLKTPEGPLTVMVLAHEHVGEMTKFSDGRYAVVLIPAGAGSIAVVAPAGRKYEGEIRNVLGGVR